MAKKKTIEQKGRKGDKVIAHLTPGEIVIPRPFAEDDDFRRILQYVFKENGASLEEFIVGSGKNRVNPETGYLEFGWLSKQWESAKKTFRHPKRLLTKPMEIISPSVKIPDLPDLPTSTQEVTEDDASRARRRSRKRLLAGGKSSTYLSGIQSTLKKRLGE